MMISRRELDDEAAMLMLEAAHAKALEIGVPQNIAVVDAGGRLLAFRRMDGAKFLSVETAIAKAVSSTSVAAPSGGASPDMGTLIGITTGGAFTNLKGGLPVMLDGRVAGAIGIGSGSPDEDVTVARAGVEALMAALDEASGEG